LSFLFNNPVEKIIEIFSQKMRFKPETHEKDIVVVIMEMQQNVTVVDYAQVQGFSRDLSKRDEWWNVFLTFLNFPLTHATYILQEPHYTGKELFTMEGKKVFIKAVDTAKPPLAGEGGDGGKGSGGGKDAPPAPGKPNFTLVR
jgi:hypothetical protein